MLTWLDLSHDNVSHWNYAETFRQHLGVGLDELAPNRLSDPEAVPLREARRLTRTATSADLLALIKKYADLRRSFT